MKLQFLLIILVVYLAIVSISPAEPDRKIRLAGSCH